MTKASAESASGSESSTRTKIGLPLICLGLLVLPFHTLWIDFEQVRRGLLLMLTGAALIAYPKLPRVRGERMGLIFIASLLLSAMGHAIIQATLADDATPTSFQSWEAAYRVAHWFALLVVVRIGVTLKLSAIATTVAVLTLATSVFGLLQRMGLAEINGYGVEREPVSTLGNLNVASEWTAIAGITVAVLHGNVKQHLNWLPILALGAACAYLTINPSRSGKVAMLAGLVLLALMRRKQRDFMPLIVAASGTTFGLAITMFAATPQISELAMQKELERGTVTLDIRFEIAAGTAGLIGESMAFGKGPGQFAVEYPRYRSQKEIEASSFNRRFPTEVRTAHNDWLELLVDGGFLALGLFAMMLFALQRGTRDKTRLIPLLVLLLLMLVRAPIGNAPAAALAFVIIGSPAAVSPGVKQRRFGLILSVIIGLSMLGLGLLPVAGNTAFIPFIRAKRDAQPIPVDAASNALNWMSYEPRWLELEARSQMNRSDLAKAAHFAARGLELRPFSPSAWLLLAEIFARGNRYGEAIKVARQGLALDPANPELRALISTALAELGDVDMAISAVAVDPHPMLRAALATHFADLARRADERQEPKQLQRYAIENTFISIADLLAAGGADGLSQIHAMNEQLKQGIAKLDRSSIDTRYPVTMALEALARGQEKLAGQYAKVAALRGEPIKPWQAAILGNSLDQLRALPAWRDLLPAKSQSE